MPKRLTTEQFIQRAKVKHGDQYDYSKVVYKGINKKVLITCPIHGEFLQEAQTHLRTKKQRACQKCSREETAKNKTLTTEEFIKRAKKSHGNKYNYSKVMYEHGRKNVSIICPVHGEFLQTPQTHLRAKKQRACQKCSFENRQKKRRLTVEEFIEKSKLIHGNKYDYSKVVYKSVVTSVTITCKKHGDFEQTPESHMRGYKCIKCFWESRSKSQEDFIKKAIEAHGNKYDYSKAEYVSTRYKIEITCPVHGSFFQNAGAHIYLGQGCPECGKNHISESLFREVLEKIFIDKFNKNYKFENMRPEWLVNPETNCRLELDCYNEELELAFELHGRQHYEPIEYFGGEKSYIKQYRRDLRTRNMCRQKGVTLFAIDNRPVYGKGLSNKQKYYEQEILKCLRTVPEKIKIKLLEAKNNNK